MTGFLHSLLGIANPRPRQIQRIHQHRETISKLDDPSLKMAFEDATELPEAIAVAAEAAWQHAGLSLGDGWQGPAALCHRPERAWHGLLPDQQLVHGG